MLEIERVSDEIEREALISLHANCPEETRKSLGLHLLEIADAVVIAAENDTSILLNRVLGLGSGAPMELGSIKKVVDAYQKLGVSSFFLHLYLNDMPNEWPQRLSDAGLEKARGWMNFHRDAAPPIEVSTNLRIEEICPDKAEDFGRIVCNAFDLTDAAIPLLAGLADDPRWYLFVSYEGDIPAGAGALFVVGDKAWIDWGATSPEFRRKGSQAAIIAARISKARELRCTHIFTETGEAVGGDPQHSYKNIRKFGFVETRLRENYKPRSLSDLE